MKDIALYYPHIHVRDDAWLKAAALYWPRIARLTPSGYPRHDSETARKLSGELGFILNISPNRYAVGISREFADFIYNNYQALQERYSIQGIIDGYGTSIREQVARWARPPHPMAPGPRSRAISVMDISFQGGYDPPHDYDDGNPYLGWIHTEKGTFELRWGLVRSGLGEEVGDWLVVAPDLAAVYTAALADRVARSNDLAVVTDREGPHGILNGWNIDNIANALLGDDQEDEPTLETDEVEALYAAVAIRTVVPARLDDIPVNKIITARRKLAAEFDAFRDHLSLLADRLTELGQIKDPLILQARLELMVERDLRRPTQELEEKLRQLNLEPAQAVLGLKSLQLPAAAAAAASAVGLPASVGQAGLVAGRLVASSVQSRMQRGVTLHTSPAGYLLGLKKQLTPGGVVERLRRTMRRAGKSMRPPAG